MRQESLAGSRIRQDRSLPSCPCTLLTLLCTGLLLLTTVEPALAQVEGAPFDNARLERLRGLVFEGRVPVVAMNPEEARQVFEQDLMRDYSDERLRADGIAGSMVGLFPPSFDLKSQMLRMALTQFGGLYSPHRKEILLIPHGSEAFGHIEMSRIAYQGGFLGNPLAHELTHALQDQHFDLESREEKLKDEDDGSTAFNSVVEGDATLAAVAYMADSLDTLIISRLVSNLYGETRQLDNWASYNQIPEGLAVPDIFAHTDGIRFVAEAYRRGGWHAVDALYSRPPVSTQQVMNPGLYFDHYKSPVAIQLAGYQKLLPAPTVTHIDTFGELLLRVILQRNPGDSSTEPARLSGQWAGDRMAILRQGDRTTVIWMLVFNDASSAREFAARYGSILDRVDGVTVAHQVTLRDRAVLCVIGDGLRQHTELPAEVWRQTAISSGP